MMRLALLASLLASSAHAHSRDVSHSLWSVRDDGASVTLRLQALDLSRLQAAGITGALDALQDRPSAALRTYLQQRLVLVGECAPDEGSFHQLRSAAGSVRFAWTIQCAHQAQSVRSDLLIEAPNHLHIARVGGATLLLDRSQPESSILAAPDPTFRAAMREGAVHIAHGVDHVLFLLLLLVVARRLRDLVGVVTGFTLGHSLTLVAASLGWVDPDTHLVEALIGLSVALLAVENAWLSDAKPSARVPLAAAALTLLLTPWLGWAAPGMALFAGCHLMLVRRSGPALAWRGSIAMLFGLVHGFGFAGALATEGPPNVATLFGFNLGVELGQLAIIMLAWPLLIWARKRDRGPLVVRWTSAIGVLMGTFWCISRALS